jgi:Ala-tRNA(Pro) deacylase
MHIPAYLAAQRVQFETLYHPPAFTAQKRAHYLHVPGNIVAKSVLLRSPEDFVVAVLPATMHVDTSRLSQAVGKELRLATHEEIPPNFPDCEWGVVPPFGKLYGLETILEDSVRPDDRLFFESNSHFEGIRMSCRDFEEVEKPGRAQFGHKRPQGPPR